jgi:HK97 family phage portal protein
MADLKVLSSPVVSVGGKKETRAGGWLATGGRPLKSTRDRLGFSAAVSSDSTHNTPGSRYSFYAVHRSLFPSQYWALYKSTPDVRACVDSIVRRIATWDWYIKVKSDPRDEDEYKRLTELANKTRNFLAMPNTDGTTWQEMMTAMVTDLLIYDAGVIELVKDESGRLSELQTWLGSEFFPVTDRHGHLLYYEQDPEDAEAETVQIAPEDLAYFKIYANNRSDLGLPMMETVINEAVTVVLASEHAMLALDADEIPPGLLVLGGISGPAAERARSDLMAMKGKDQRIRVVTSPQPSGIDAKWLELRHTPKDLELLHVVAEMRRSIWRVFGVMPVELGETAGVPRAAAEIQMDVSSSHLISPILELIQARVNAQIIPRLIDPDDGGKVAFTFDRITPSTAEEKLSMAKRAETLIRQGVLTVNEARSDMGLMPIEGGDIAIVTTSYGPMPLAQVVAGYSPAVTVPLGGAFADLDDVGAAAPGEAQETGSTAEATPTNTDAPSVLSNRPIRRGFKRPSLPNKEQGWRAALLNDPGLPSHWANPREFAGKKTLPLTPLGDVVRTYTWDVSRLYVDTANEVQAIIGSAYGGGGISVSDSMVAKKRINEALDAFEVKWQMATIPAYVDAARLGYTTASELLQDKPDLNPTSTALAYQDKAMLYLKDSRGIVGTLRQQLVRIVEAATLDQRDRADKVSPDDPPDEVIGKIDGEFRAQSSRIENWSGKLVALSYIVFVRAMQGTVAIENGKPVVWKYEWVTQPGKNCGTCVQEGASGARNLSELAVYPAQDTTCGARCRCVLVVYKEDEIGSTG